MEKNSSEIAKLTERISKDPKSKLFVPLAEEYKKIGDTEMAIHVLLEGLKSNPGYVTARSILGRLYFDKGDLEGAKKEFEAVVESIPDNLIAQKKLGDVFILLDHPNDAIKHYKIALSLNPKDSEFASIVSDVEAGKDVRARIQRPKSMPLPRPAAKKAEKKPEIKQALPVARPVRPMAIPEEPVLSEAPAVSEEQPAPAATEMVVETPPAAAASASQPPIQETLPASATAEEEAEEVLFVEPLEPEPLPEVETSASRIINQPQTVQEEIPQPEPAVPVAEPAQEIFREAVSAPEVPHDLLPETAPEVLAEAAQSSAETTEEVLAAADVFTEEERTVEAPEVPAEVPEAPVVEEAVSADISAALAEEAAAPGPGAPQAVAEGQPEQSDDFTTDTLAELYISQGFYEKAIDIYERMLADNPNSRGLKEKLQRVRTAAAETETEEPGTRIVSPVREEGMQQEAPAAAIPEDMGAPTVLEEAQEYRPPEVDEIVPKDEPITAGFLEEAKEYVPPAESEEVTLDAEVLEEPEAETEAILEAEQVETGPEEPAADSGQAGFDVFASAPAMEYVPPTPSATSGEAREYVPPPEDAGTVEPPSAPGPHGAKQITGRKETIERLETWLRNIQKEK